MDTKDVIDLLPAVVQHGKQGSGINAGFWER